MKLLANDDQYRSPIKETVFCNPVDTILTKSLEQILTTTQRDTTCTMNYYYNSDVTTQIIYNKGINLYK